MLKQKEAVYNAIKEIKSFEDGSVVTLTKEEKKTVRDVLVEGFKNKTIELIKAQSDLPKYSSALLNNWMRKDTRMNGDVVYKTKNPGSRAGSQDVMIKNLRILKSNTTDTNDIAKIEEAIQTRLLEIKPEAAKKVVDLNEIPRDLLESLGINND